MRAPESHSPGAPPARPPEPPAGMTLGSTLGLGPSFGLAQLPALPCSAEPCIGSPVSEQTPLAGSPMRPAACSAGLPAPTTARLPTIKSRRRVLLCESNVEPNPPSMAGQWAGGMPSPGAALGPWAAAKQAGGCGASADSSPVQAANAWLTGEVEENALRQTGLWSPSSPVALPSPGAGAARAATPSLAALAAPRPIQAPRLSAACTPVPVSTASKSAAAHPARASWEAHAAPAAQRLQPTAYVQADPFTGFARVPSPVKRAQSAAGAASSGSSGAARRALDMSSVPAQQACCAPADTTPGLHFNISVSGPAEDGVSGVAAPDLPHSAAAAAVAGSRPPLACASAAPTSCPAKRRIKLPQCPLLPLVSAANRQQPEAPGSCRSACPVAASGGAHACVTAQQDSGLGDKRPHVPPAAEPSKPARVTQGLDAGRAAQVHGSAEGALAGRGSVGEAGGAASGQRAQELAPAACQVDDWSSVFSFFL